MRRNGLSIAVIVASLVVMSYPSLSQHVRNSADPLFFNDDVRQHIWPFLRYHDSALFQDDYLADYQLSVYPTGFLSLYRLSAPWVDPRIVSKVLPYLLLAVMLSAVGFSAWHLGGPAAAWGSLALCLSTDTYLREMIGGVPRAFGFPLAAIAGASLVLGKPYWLAVVVCLGAAFYYPIAVLSGLTLVLFLALPEQWMGLPQPWSWRRRVVIVAATGVLSLSIMIAPRLAGPGSFGRAIGPDDWARYPEAGMRGRFTPNDVVQRLPLGYIWSESSGWATSALWARDEPWVRPLWEFGQEHSQVILFIAVTILVIGYARLAREKLAARRLLVLPVAGLVAYLLAWTLIPHLYIPGRYVKFCVPVAFSVMLPAAIVWIPGYFRRFRAVRWTPAVLTVGICMSIVLLLGGRGTTDGGLTVRIPDNQKRLYDYLVSMPSDVLLAGWPSTMDNVPYVTGKRVLITQEAHLPYHETYLKEMRRRMQALIDAYFAPDLSPIVHLRDTFGVTHLLIDQRHYHDDPPRYFEPFDTLITQSFQRLQAGPETLRQVGAAAVFQHGDIIVLDLNRITS